LFRLSLHDHPVKPGNASDVVNSCAKRALDLAQMAAQMTPLMARPNSSGVAPQFSGCLDEPGLETRV
jgi:hypothetical protein